MPIRFLLIFLRCLFGIPALQRQAVTSAPPPPELTLAEAEALRAQLLLDCAVALADSPDPQNIKAARVEAKTLLYAPPELSPHLN